MRRKAPPVEKLRVTSRIEEYEDLLAAAELFRAIQKAQALAKVRLEKTNESAVKPTRRSPD